MTHPTVLILPGLGNSGPDHWQSWLQARIPGARRVEQADWDQPVPSEWMARLESAILVTPGRVILVAHSASCALVAHWAASGTRSGSVDKVAGALLVGPTDVESAEHTPPAVHVFAPIPTDPLPFNTIVVGSDNDPYCSTERACAFAVLWGADFLNAGAVGHINVASGFGPWPMGETLVKELIAQS
ncbi:RBBP9/YdeN family alpha/beta hydrolase [Azospirillum griseum]|uniref:Alpha/beta hydrolase n=1 Tax=Azospirillum griseum TaxID=2496639 RepID=A0A431VFK4_9PROT|nr:alpha/beta hydrolase [Azospirillum griseum]RTR18339.1 alpha/beta hydrolase [Azospirillum griseum]